MQETRENYPSDLHLQAAEQGFQAKGFVKGGSAGIAFPDMEGDVVAAAFRSEGLHRLEEPGAYMPATRGFVDAYIIYIQRSKRLQAAGILPLKHAECVAKDFPAPVINEYWRVGICENGKQFFIGVLFSRWTEKVGTAVMMHLEHLPKQFVDSFKVAGFCLSYHNTTLFRHETDTVFLIHSPHATGVHILLRHRTRARQQPL